MRESQDFIIPQHYFLKTARSVTVAPAKSAAPPWANYVDSFTDPEHSGTLRSGAVRSDFLDRAPGEFPPFSQEIKSNARGENCDDSTSVSKNHWIRCGDCCSSDHHSFAARTSIG